MLLVCLHGIRELAFEGELGHALKAWFFASARRLH